MALHAAVLSYILYSTDVPDLGFDFQLPTEVEFGLTDAVSVSEGAASAADPTSPESAHAEGPGEGSDGGVPYDGGPDGGPELDAGQRRRRDAGPPVVAAADTEGEGAGDEGEGEGDAQGNGRGVAFLPAGSQIALRIDVARIRRSPLAEDVRALMAVLPDWQALLEGSGIDPLDDLDRVLIASPNLQRSRLIVAGRTTGDQAGIRAAAQRLADAAGEPLAWRRTRGAEVAPWHDRDPTDRVIAIIGPRHFVIARPEDLPRVLAVARNRAADRAEGEHPADALLSMEEGEGLSLEVEGARNFARGRPQQRGPIDMVPTEVRLALSELPEDRVAARSRWSYESAERADEARSYWDRMRVGYARNIITQVLGVGAILDRATLETDGDHFDGNVDMGVPELQRLLGLARGMFVDRARAQAGGAGATPPLALPTPAGPSGATPTPPAPSLPPTLAPGPPAPSAPSPPL